MPQKNPSVTVDFSQMRYEVFEKSTYDENKKTPKEYGRTENTHKKIRGRVSRQIGDEQKLYRPEDKRAQCTRRGVSSLYRGCSVVPSDILMYFRVLRCGLDCPEGFEALYATETLGLNRNRLTDMVELKRLFRLDKRLIFPLIPFGALCGGDAGLKRRLLDALDYFSAVRAAGEIGRQLLFSQVGNEPSCFTYIHDFPIQGLDDVILLPLLEAIRKKCPVELHQSSYTRQGINNPIKVYPLYILDKGDLCGRRHLLAYPIPNSTEQAGTTREIQKALRTIRLDYIDCVEICPDGNMETFNKAEEAAKQALNFIYNAGYKWRTGTETYEPKEISAAFLNADGVCDAAKNDLELHLGLNYSMKKSDKRCIDGEEIECINYKFKVYEANEMMTFFLARVGYIADLKGWANIGPRVAAHVADLKTLYSRTREEGQIMDAIPAPAAMTDSYLNAFDQPNQGRTPPSRESYTLKKERLYNPYMSPFIPLYIRMLAIEAEVKAQVENEEKAKKEIKKRQTEEIGTWLNGEIVSGFDSMLFPETVLSGMMPNGENETASKLVEELRNLDADHRISMLGERPMTYDEICFVREMLADKKASLFFSDEEIQKILQVLSPSYHFFCLLDTLGADQEAFFEALKAVCQQEEKRNQLLEAQNADLDNLATADFQKVRTALEALKDTGKALKNDAVCRILYEYAGFLAKRNSALPVAYDPIRLIEAREQLIDEMIVRCTSITETRQAEASAFLNSDACQTAGNVQGEAACLTRLLGTLNAVQLDEPMREALGTWLNATISAFCEHAVPVKTGDAEADARALACWAKELDAGMRRQLGTCPLSASVHKSRLKTWIWEVYGVDPNAILQQGMAFAAPIHSFDPGKIAVGDTGAEEAFFACSRALPERMDRLGTASYLDSNKIGEVDDSNVFRTLLTAIHEGANVRITMKSGERKIVQPLSLQYDKFEGCFSVMAGLGQDGYGVFSLSSIERADLSGNTVASARTLADYHRQNRVFLRVSSARDGIERVMMALNAYDKRSLHVFYENQQTNKRYPFAIVAVNFATQDKNRLINTLFAFGSTVEVLDVDSERYPNVGTEMRAEMLARIDRQAELIEANAAWKQCYLKKVWLRQAEKNRLPNKLEFVSANSLNYWMKRFEYTIQS